MSQKDVFAPREKCLDCWNFIRDGFFSKFFRCRFGLIPLAFPNPEDGNKMLICCGAYVDFKNKPAPAWRVLEKLRKKARKNEANK